MFDCLAIWWHASSKVETKFCFAVSFHFTPVEFFFLISFICCNIILYAFVGTKISTIDLILQGTLLVTFKLIIYICNSNFTKNRIIITHTFKLLYKKLLFFFQVVFVTGLTFTAHLQLG